MDMAARRTTENEGKWRRLIWFATLVLCLLTGLAVAHLSDSGRPRVLADEIPSGCLAVPSPWKEISRVSSPNGKWDAVVVSGSSCIAIRQGSRLATPVRQEDMPEHTVTCIRICARGERIDNEAAYILPSQVYLQRLSRKFVFVAGDVKSAAIKWAENSRTLDVNARLGAVLYQSPRFRLQEAEGGEVVLALNYNLQVTSLP
jgi:hypothetical protein